MAAKTFKESRALDHRGCFSVYDEKPSVSIKQARRLLGPNFRDISDEEIEHLVGALQRLARSIVQK